MKNKKCNTRKMRKVKSKRNYVIPARQVVGRALTVKQKKEIELFVKEVVKEYGETLRLLGNKRDENS